MTTLKPLSDQVMVITGASSGIGLTTARAAARAGARVVLASRNDPVLEEIAAEIHRAGGEALAVACDVGDYLAVKRLGERAMDRFGRIDTWVNNAGVSIYAELTRTPIDDHRRLFETNYWGVVYGSIVAIHHLRDGGGALINVGDVLGDRAIPLQGAYCASKHAVRGFTEALRMEIEHEEVPVSVTLIQPASIATPFEEHARAYTEHEPRLVPPLYAPDLVARAILRAATRPVREEVVGSSGRALVALSKAAPRLVDRLMETTMFEAQQGPEPRNGRHDNLFAPATDGHERTEKPHRVIERGALEGTGRKVLFGAVIAIGLAILARGL